MLSIFCQNKCHEINLLITSNIRTKNTYTSEKYYTQNGKINKTIFEEDLSRLTNS